MLAFRHRAAAHGAYGDEQFRLDFVMALHPAVLKEVQIFNREKSAGKKLIYPFLHSSLIIGSTLETLGKSSV